MSTPDDLAALSAERASRIQAQERADLSSVLSSPAGRRMIWRILSDLGIYSASFIHGQPYEYAVFRDSRRQYGVDVIARCEDAVPGVYRVMGREAAEREAADDMEQRRLLAEITDDHEP